MLEPIAITELPECARFSLRVRQRTADELAIVSGFRLAMPINRFETDGKRSSARLGPDEWLLRSPESERAEIPRELETAFAGRLYSLVDIGQRQAAFAVAGTGASAVINAGCPLDLHESVFPVGAATRTLLGRADIVLWRPDEVCWHLECSRSFSPYVCRFLQEAASEHQVPGARF